MCVDMPACVCEVEVKAHVPSHAFGCRLYVRSRLVCLCALLRRILAARLVVLAYISLFKPFCASSALLPAV